MIKLTKEDVANRKHEEFDPNRHDFRWNSDYTEVVIVPLTWWDDSSYADYQGDSHEHC